MLPAQVPVEARQAARKVLLQQLLASAAGQQLQRLVAQRWVLLSTSSLQPTKRSTSVMCWSFSSQRYKTEYRIRDRQPAWRMVFVCKNTLVYGSACHDQHSVFFLAPQLSSRMISNDTRRPEDIKKVVQGKYSLFEGLV